MSKQYVQYLATHRAHVCKAYFWVNEHLPELCTRDKELRTVILTHDSSKIIPDEYDAYDAYFYGSDKSQKANDDFKRAWLLHIHRNPHHWQHWVLNNDDPDEGETLLEMPYEQILAMICDWWSFSWTSGDLYEIFNWYDRHKNYIKLNDNTRATVEDVLDRIKDQLDTKKVK